MAETMLVILAATVRTSGLSAESAAEGVSNDTRLATDLPALQPSSWDTSFTGRTEAGYRSNIGLSAFTEDKSAFAGAGFDFLMLRLPSADSWESTVFLSADHRGYFNSGITDAEETFVASATVRYRTTPKAAVGLNILYLYQDQVFDASSNDLDVGSVKAQVHLLRARPTVRYQLAEHTTVEFGPQAAWQNYIAPLDDYWEFGGLGNLTTAVSTHSDLVVSLESKLRPYDHREQADAQGIAIAGQRLELEQHEAAVAYQRHWGDQDAWRWVTKVAGMQNTDGGSGYYDYMRYRVSTQLRARHGLFSFSLEGQLAHYGYAVQTASTTDPSSRSRLEFLVGFKPTVQVNSKLKWYAHLEWERTLSNNPSDPYTASTVATGFELEFF